MSPVFENVARFGAAILINSLWQGALIAGVTALALRCFPKANASTRYAAWSLALAALFVVPIVTSLTRITVTPASTTAQHVTATASRATTNAPHAHTRVSAERTSSTQTIPQTPAPWRLSFAMPTMLATILFGLWAAIALVVVIRLVVALWQLERLKNDALPLAVDYRDTMTRWQSAGKGERDVRICVSDEIDVPVAVGLFDAMILLPKQLVESLDASEIDQICLHELAHLLRNDDWSNGLQRLLMALMIYNPAAWFIGRQMDVEREVACDDFVLELTGAAKPYAFCLTKMAEMTSWPHAPLPAPGVFVTRKNISIRIERLLRSGRAIGRGITPSVATAVVAGLVAVVAVLRTVTPSIAFTLPSIPATAAPIPTPAPIASPAQAAHHPVAPPAPGKRVDVPARTIDIHIPAIHVPNAHMVADTTRGCMGCNYRGATLEHHDFRNQSLTGSNFERADLRGSTFDGAALDGVNFDGADLRNVTFRNASLEGCNMANARLDGIDFTGAHLDGCNIDVSKLSPPQVRNVLSNCTGCNYEGANMRGLDLHGIHLEGENMRGADLRDTNLSGVVFTGVNLSGASLRGAKLDGAVFEGCNFNGVDLRGVDLSHASIEGSSLEHAIMR